MDLDKHVAVVGSAVDALASHAATPPEEPPDLENLVRAIQAINAVGVRLRDARDDLAELAHDVMPQRQVVIPGLGPVERKAGWSRKDWEHDGILSHVARWAAEDRLTYAQEHDGELPPESEAQTTVRLLRRYAGIAYWKVGTTREERGFDVDQWCRREKNRPGISLPKQEQP